MSRNSAPACPICGTSSPEIVRTFTADQAATHFVPASREADRHAELRQLIVEVWEGSETATIRRCPRCSFGFAHPWADGTARFYNLVSQGDPHYPRHRWEFGRTIRSLATVESGGGGNLLEVGAGTGAFLEQLRSSPIGNRYTPVAIEYDRGAVAMLQQAGFQTVSRSLQELAVDSAYRGRFGAICMFQTLEHIADIQGTFGAAAAVLSEDGNLFVSVPYRPATEQQENLTGFWDMPPNHVGRWTRAAFDAISERHGLAVTEWETEPASRPSLAWRLAVYTVAAQAYDEHSLAGRINALRDRRLRGPAKRFLAAASVLRLLRAPLLPPTQWVRISRKPV